MSLPNHGESCECARCAYAAGYEEGLSDGAAEVARLQAKVAELERERDLDWGESYTKFCADLANANARIDALRAALVKHRDELCKRAEELYPNGTVRRTSFLCSAADELDEALSADSAAGSPVVAESATAALPECDGCKWGEE